MQTTHVQTPQVQTPQAQNSQAQHSKPQPNAVTAELPDHQHIAGATAQEAASDFRLWPEPWRSLWLKTPHDPRIIWTYYDLGAHMGGKPDPAVGKLLQSLIYYFRWAKGTIAFWPMTELSGDQLLPNPDMFWQGVDKLGARHVAIFGPNVLTIIAPDAPANTKIIRVGEVTLYVLPGLEELAPMLPHERLIALQSVKQLSL